MAVPALQIADEVAQALSEGRAVVALESSIVAHGFPAPRNLTVGREMTAAVAAEGAVPALVAVIDGRIRVGLDDEDLGRLARESCLKCSARDLGFAVATKALGATTVAATARIARIAGIRVFATGGIGGVHPVRGAPDISADLLELSRTPVAVICSGAKSILDLPATLEALEALSVPVVGYATSVFPAFHSADSGLRLDHRVDDAATVAELMRAHWLLEGAGAIVICNPPPAAQAIDRRVLDAMVRQALQEAENAGIQGQALTPFLLADLNARSKGRTLEVNHALAVSNAGLGARIALADAALRRQSGSGFERIRPAPAR